MAMRVKKVKARAMIHNVGKRFYFETQNGMHVSVRAHNGLLAVKQLPKWILL